MIRITVLSSILVMVVLLIRKCFYYHITRRLQYALWLSVPLYLILAPFLCIEIPVHGGQELYWIMESGNRRDNAHVHIPVLPFVILAERALADPQYRSLKAA